MEKENLMPLEGLNDSDTLFAKDKDGELVYMSRKDAIGRIEKFRTKKTEYHIFKHWRVSSQGRPAMGSLRIYFTGIDAKSKAIEAAIEMEKKATLGVNFSVQIYLYGENETNRPVKLTCWKNGKEIDYIKRRRILERRRLRRITEKSVDLRAQKRSEKSHLSKERIYSSLNAKMKERKGRASI